jgi:mono/diheme cytochrome c family protein
MHSPAPPRPFSPAVFLLTLLLLAGGCYRSAPPQFELNLEGRDAKSVGLSQAQVIRETLKTLFGTPDEPRVPPGVKLRLELLQAAAGPIGGDERGSQHGLFRRHCAACHGISGRGNGPAAAVLEPYPRDFRNGVFKWTSTVGGAKPTHDDLERTLLRGIPGTAMPSHAPLAPEEIEALVEYVQYLSIRGQTELYLLQTVVDEDESGPLAIDAVLREGVLPIAEMWEKAASQAVQAPPPPPLDTPQQLAAAIERGRLLYSGKNAQCVKCHGPQGRGNGEETELYDDWNKPKKGLTPEQTAALAPRFSLPIQKLRPRDFAQGIFHGGSRPLDIYHRIYVGIKGTPMPPAGPASGSKGVLTPEQIWDVVAFIRSLAARAP